jgi:DNA-binding response OmpR family regulator
VRSTTIAATTKQSPRPTLFGLLAGKICRYQPAGTKITKRVKLEQAITERISRRCLEKRLDSRRPLRQPHGRRGDRYVRITGDSAFPPARPALGAARPRRGHSCRAAGPGIACLGLESVLAFDIDRIISHLDNPPHRHFSVVLLDSRLPLAAATWNRFADLVAATRTRTDAPILTLGAGSRDDHDADVDLPLRTPTELIAAGAGVLATVRRAQTEDRSPGLRRWGPLHLDKSTWQVRWDSTPVRLTAQQFQLLDTLVAAEGATVSSALLAQVLYVRTLPGDLERVRAHIARLRYRLRAAAPDAADALLTVHGRGYRLTLPGRPRVLGAVSKPLLKPAEAVR